MHGHGGHEHGVELFTRGVQANIGMGFGVLAFAVAMGALLAVVFCVVYGRVDIPAQPLAALLAAAMLLCLNVVPALKYPPNPPATSLEEIDPPAHPALSADGGDLGRSAGCRGVSACAAGADRLGAWNATLAGAGAYLVAVAVVMLVLPAIDETPERSFPGRRALRVPVVLAGHTGRDVGDHRDVLRGSDAAVARLSRAVEHPGVSEVVRLTLVSHAMTDAMASRTIPRSTSR